jgi:hypothetical protein
MEFQPWPKIPSLATYLATATEEDLNELNQPLTLSVKIHGTNAAFRTDGKEIWCQSRTRIITPMNDNAGFAQWIEGHKSWILDYYHMNDYCGVVTIFGEFAGRGIQKKVGVSEMEKFFYIFHGQGAQGADFVNKEERFYPHMSVSDWGNGSLMERLEFIKDEIDSECPFYKAMTGKVGVGEGLVAFNQSGIPLFKFKGKSHEISEPKTPKPPEELNQCTLDELGFATTERLNQIYLQVGGGRILNLPEIPIYSHAVLDDIISEEGKISAKGQRHISAKAIQFLKSKLGECQLLWPQ